MRPPEGNAPEERHWKKGWAERSRCDGGDYAEVAEADGAVGNSFGLEDAALMRDLASLLCDEPEVARGQDA